MNNLSNILLKTSKNEGFDFEKMKKYWNILINRHIKS